MKNSIKFKLGLVMGGFVALILVIIGMTFWTVNAQKSDGLVINMAGRQRMLSQRVTKEVMAMLQGKVKKADVLATADLFDKSLNALISGDPPQGIPPTKEPDIVAQLNEVKSIWGVFKLNLGGIIGIKDEKSGIYDHLASRNIPLLKAMNGTVTMMEKKGLAPKTINLAGKQRMLSQKMTKEALGLDMGTATAEEFLGTVSLFDRTLRGLRNGDIELGLKPIKDAAILTQLGKVETEWQPFETNAERLVKVSKEANQYLSYILANNVPLLKEMNKAVGMYEAASLGKIKRLKVVQIVLLLVTGAVFAGGWVYLSNVIIKPVKEIAEVAQSVADGDLTGEDITIHSQDEMGMLAKTVNTMKENLSKMIGNIRENANQVALGSNQLASGTADFSQRITEQSSSVEETSSTVEEISAGVGQNADSCRQANKLSVECRNKAEEGGKVMGNMMASIKEINGSSKQISEIINVIQEISFQTNLLALNAAVEAARAGEQGKGFAVVAVEVRNLAQRSAQAAKEITSLIQDNVKKAENGSQLTEMTQANLEEIITSVKKLSDLISEINVSSQEQASGVEQVNKAISQMDQVTQQNSSLVEEMSATGEELSGQARMLIDLVSTFKVSTNGVGGSYVAPSQSNVTQLREADEKAEDAIVPISKAEDMPKAVGIGTEGFVEL